MPDNKEYITKDIYEASFLVLLGFEIKEFRKEGPKFIWFVFEENKQCRAEIDKYWKNEATVNVKQYSDQIQRLKDRIFAMTERKRSEEGNFKGNYNR